MLVGIAACLSDESGVSLDEGGPSGAGVGDHEKGGSTASLLAPPPGGIIDTQPHSGWTEGTFSVNHNGAAQYHLPLAVPDGRGGLQPEIALHYNSQGGNGLVGVGWSLAAGLSSITPCGRTLAQDGRIEPPQFQPGTANNVFCLDGQRLRPAAGGGPGEQDYRTERETFSRIRAYEVADIVEPLTHSTCRSCSNLKTRTAATSTLPMSTATALTTLCIPALG